MCKVYTDVGGIKYLYNVCPPVRKLSTRKSSWIISTYMRTTHGISITYDSEHDVETVFGFVNIIQHVDIISQVTAVLSFPGIIHISIEISR